MESGIPDMEVRETRNVSLVKSRDFGYRIKAGNNHGIYSKGSAIEAELNKRRTASPSPYL